MLPAMEQLASKLTDAEKLLLSSEIEDYLIEDSSMEELFDNVFLVHVASNNVED